MLDGLIFGLVDNGVLLAGAYLGCDLGERLGNGRGALGAILGAGIGNTVSDALGAALDPALRSMVLGIALGCLIPLLLVPVIERWRSRSKGVKPSLTLPVDEAQAIYRTLVDTANSSDPESPAHLDFRESCADAAELLRGALGSKEVQA